MKYHKIPKRWRIELLSYVVEYLKSGHQLSVRQYAREHDMKQSTVKRYFTTESRDWVIDNLLLIQSQSGGEDDGELYRKSRCNSGLWF